MKKPYVIEVSVIADAEDDAEAERIGKAVTDALRQIKAGGRVNHALRRIIQGAHRFTVVNVDGEFLEGATEEEVRAA